VRQYLYFCTSFTKVQILRHLALSRGFPGLRRWRCSNSLPLLATTARDGRFYYSVYLHYQYKSTNTDAKAWQCVDVDEYWVVEDAKGTNKSAKAGVSIFTQSICVTSTKVFVKPLQ
jgi:hypothetical protein